MKKYAVLSATAFVFSIASFAQADNATDQGLTGNSRLSRQERKEERRSLRKQLADDVSYFAEQAFYHDFGNLPNVSWRHENGFDIASFESGGVAQSAFYDREAELTGTTMRKSFFDLPEAAQQYINKKYPDYAITGVVFFDDNEANATDMILYDQQFDDADNYFVELSKDGKNIVLQSDMRGNVQFFTELK